MEGRTESVGREEGSRRRNTLENISRFLVKGKKVLSLSLFDVRRENIIISSINRLVVQSEFFVCIFIIS